MEKDEKLKLVNENGETILMTKSKYLELSKQRGRDTKIPQLEDGAYDCDVFGGDGVSFDFDIDISGTLSLGAYATTKNISADSGVFLGKVAQTLDIVSEAGDIVIGPASSVHDVSGRYVICGKFLNTNGHIISAHEELFYD